MNTLLIPFSQYVQQNRVDVDLISIAAGLAVSRHLNIPTTEVESINMHYAGQAQTTINLYLSTINETVVINMDRALETARSAYMLRYHAAYPKTDGSVILPSEGSFFSRYFGIHNFFGEITLSKLDKDPTLVTNLVNRLLTVLPELIKEQ